MTNRSEDEPAELSSPACSMSEADDTYMGYAGRAELVGFLNELLEAERAGARVTLKSAREAGAGPVAKLLWTIQRDEARWCAMLIRHIKTLGETPSAKVGAFYMINAVSVGFISLAREPLREGGWRFTQWELLQLSIVSVPANPNALVIERSLGRRDPSIRELGQQIGRVIVAARLRNALAPRRTTYAERVAIAAALRRGE
jgi:hypothetical protein